MTTSSRLALLYSLLACSMPSIVPVSSAAQQLPQLAEELAKTYGSDSFGEVEAIRYTWGKGEISRSWVWQPKTDTVTYEGEDKEGKQVKVTYRRSDIASQSDVVKKEIDPFLNDQYWLLLPLHVSWDGAPHRAPNLQYRRCRKPPSGSVATRPPAGSFDESRLTAHGPGTVLVLPTGQAHFHWAKSGEYITQVSAIGPLGLTYIDRSNDPRTRTPGRA
jgi:hypothetical protein